MPDDQMPGMGHNSAAFNLPPEKDFVEQVIADNGELKDRLLDLRVGLDRLPEKVDESNASLYTDFIAQCQKAAKDWEAARKKAKGPVDELGKAIQAAFITRVEPIVAKGMVLDKAKARLAIYHNELAKREAERKAAAEKAAAEAAAKARAEAEAAEEAARKAAQSDDREAAIAAQQARDDAEAASKDAEKAHKGAVRDTKTKAGVRGEYSSAGGYTRKAWKFEVTDISKLPLSFLVVDEKAVREWLSAETKDGGTPPEVEGLRLYQEDSFHVRGG